MGSLAASVIKNIAEHFPRTHKNWLQVFILEFNVQIYIYIHSTESTVKVDFFLHETQKWTNIGTFIMIT